jgi:DNA-binding transcriptional LysR family regulator
MDFTALKYFFETAKCGSIRQASNRLYVTPSAVSRQIAKLEHDLDCQLFERHASGMRLTAAGTLLSEQLQTTLRELNRVRSLIGDLQGLKRGEISIHCIEGVVDSWLPVQIARFNASHPSIVFHITVSSTERIAEAVMGGNADVGISFKVKRRAGMTVIASQPANLMAVMSPAHPLANRRRLSFAECARYPLALPDQSFGVRRMVDDIAHADKVDIPHLITTNSITMVRSLARNGVAMTLLPYLSVVRDCADGHLVALPLTNKNQFVGSLEICVQEGRALPVAAGRFLADLKPALTGI